MPARPMMIDAITEKAKIALVREIVKVKCCVGACLEDGAFLITLRFSGQQTDIYGVCKKHLNAVTEKSEKPFEKPKDQGFFLY